MLKHLILLLSAVVTLSASAAPEASSPKYIFLFLANGVGNGMLKLYLREHPDSVLKSFKIQRITATDNAKNGASSVASGTTAIACGVPTILCRIAKTPDEKPLTSLAYKLKKRGYKIGIIADTPIIRSNVAPFFAVRSLCGEHDGILDDLCRSGFDFFATSEAPRGKKINSRQAQDMLISAGYRILPGKKLRTMNPGARNFLITPNGNKLRRAGSPSIAGITDYASQLLSSGGNNFFMVVSAGSAGYFSHRHDAASALKSIYELEQAIRSALEFSSLHPGETLIVISSESDVGNIQMANAERTGFHLRQTLPYLEISNRLEDMQRQKYSDEKLIKAALELVGVPKISREEQRRMMRACGEFRKRRKLKHYGGFNPLVIEAFHIRDRYNGFRYQTFTHSLIPVTTFVHGTGSGSFRSMRNTSEIHHCIMAAAGTP